MSVAVLPLSADGTKPDTSALAQVVPVVQLARAERQDRVKVVSGEHRGKMGVLSAMAGAEGLVNLELGQGKTEAVLIDLDLLGKMLPTGQ
jgi:hypothetical protein